MLSAITKEKLPDFKGDVAFGGALRFYSESDDGWLKEIGGKYGELFPSLKFFAEDAFGVIYGLDSNNGATLFHADSADIEPLGITEEQFYKIICDDPEGTISYGFYEYCARSLRQIAVHEHFAFKVELALGGEMTLENVYICDRRSHFLGLAKVAKQIHAAPVGTRFNPKDR
jgi:hypothetical protein